ncbi:MAG: nucleotidyltransferase domain-containing protein [Candidatus Tectomicrobia bacterium]
MEEQSRLGSDVRYEAVHTVYLFGSRVRGTQRMVSDVDVAVAFAPRSLAWDKVELQEQLAAQLGVPVQVAASKLARVSA